MVFEIADIDVHPGSEEEFLAAYRGVRSVLIGTPGCLSARMTRGIESPSRFVLLVQWETLEAHEQNFRASARYAKWRAAIGPYFVAAPRVEHVAEVE
jgi:heme-degrading monooxygenase HmoA